MPEQIADEDGLRELTEIGRCDGDAPRIEERAASGEAALEAAIGIEDVHDARRPGISDVKVAADASYVKRQVAGGQIGIRERTRKNGLCECFVEDIDTAGGVVCKSCRGKAMGMNVPGSGRIYGCAWCETELYRVDSA